MYLKKRDKKEIFTIIGIAIGVFSVFLITIICYSGKQIFNEGLSGMGFDSILINATDNSLSKLCTEDIESISKNEEVISASPLITGVGKVNSNKYLANVVLGGIDNNSASILGIDIIYGHLFRNEDISQGKKVCIIADNMAQEFFHRKNCIGKKITLTVNGKSDLYTIIGISSSENNYLMNMASEYVPYFVYLPYTTYIECKKENHIDNILIKLEQDNDFDMVGESIAQKLNIKYGYKNLYKYENLSGQKEKLEEILGAITILLISIGFISFIVSGMGTITIMLSMVNERMREIGIKRAIGATEKDIIKDFLLDAIILNGKGCLFGAGAIFILILTFKIFTNIPIFIPYTLLTKIFVLMLILGVIFGVYPAMKATKLDPVIALKNE